MSPAVDPDLDRYATEHSTPEPELLRDVAAATREYLDAPQMMVGPLEGRFLEMLVHLSQPERVLEIGTFSGYSALSMASALPSGGRIVTCEVDPKAAEMARRHFQASPWADRIELREGPALATIAELDGPFDLVFIDADKVEYRDYYEAVLPLLSDRGVIAVDNVLWSGRVLDPDDERDDTRAIAAFNDHVTSDPRVVAVMLTIRDGVTLIRRRPEGG
ncbi:MAG TPA: class I SAM-dependent methyltransferase [Acidimicrobiales bacterium]|nr:class I SAM-dependent methyltransferase [Acidimicrobiales bacterium]